MKEIERTFGSYYEGNYIRRCKRCNHIVEFPFVALNSHVSTQDRLKRFNFRVVKRESWKEEGNLCGGYGPMMLTKREENIDSCMNCWNNRGTDCDEPWTEDSCDIHHCHFISPFTICDLHQIRMRRLRILPDGNVEGIPEYCWEDKWMSLEDVEKWNEERNKIIEEEARKRKKRKKMIMREKNEYFM